MRARVAVLSIKLTNNAGWRSDDVHLAILGRSATKEPTVNGDFSLVGELPLVGCLTAVHFKHAGWWSKFGYQGIDVFPDIFSPKSGSNFFPRCCAASNADAAKNSGSKPQMAWHSQKPRNQARVLFMADIVGVGG